MQERFQKKKLLALEKINISKKLYFELRKRFIIYDNSKNNIKKLNQYDAIFTKFNYEINKRFLLKAKNLKYIISNVTGLDSIDTIQAKKQGIKIFSLKNKKKFLRNITSTSEFTFALMLSLLRKIPYAHNSVINKIYDRYSYVGYNLKDKTLGIIGFGRNGKLIYKYAKSFSMKVIFADKNYKGKVKGNVPLNYLLKNSDIITLNVDLNKSTKNLIDNKKLKLINKNAFLINTSRCEIVNQKDLFEALKKDKIAGFASDFLEQKNFTYTTISKKLIKLAKNKKNVIFTPHLGGATYESMFQTEEFVFKQLILYEKKIIYK